MVHVTGKFAQSKQRAGRHTAGSVSEQVRRCVVKQVYFGAVWWVEMVWFQGQEQGAEEGAGRVEENTRCCDGGEYSTGG